MNETLRWRKQRKKGFILIVILWTLVMFVLSARISTGEMSNKDLYGAIGLLMMPIFLTGLAIGADVTHKIYEREDEKK